MFGGLCTLEPWGRFLLCLVFLLVSRVRQANIITIVWGSLYPRSQLGRHGPLIPLDKRDSPSGGFTNTCGFCSAVMDGGRDLYSSYIPMAFDLSLPLFGWEFRRVRVCVFEPHNGSNASYGCSWRYAAGRSGRTNSGN